MSDASTRLSFLKSLALAGSVCAAVAGPANAAYSKFFDASSATPSPDPTTAAGGTWLIGGVSPTTVAKAAGSDGTTNYWQVNDNNTNSTTGATSNNSVAYSITDSGTGSEPALGTAFTDPSGWTYEVKAKILDSRVASAGAGTAATFFDIRSDPDGVAPTTGKIYTFALFQNDPTYGNSIYFAPNGSSVLPANNGVLIKTMDLSDAFHTYDMVYTPNADPTVAGVSLYIDGVFAYKVADSVAGASGVGRVQTGSGASGAVQNIEYKSFFFQTGAFTPEPSVLGLAGVGVVGLMRRRRA